MSIDLTGLPIRSAPPTLVEFGGLLTPALGGPVQRIDRLGSRWSWAFETVPMRVEPDGRRWAAAIAQAKREGAVLAVSQPDFPTIGHGAVVVAANTSSGRSVPVAGLPPHYPVLIGQWVSIIHAGQRYLDQVVARVDADAGGGATLSILNLLRVPLSAGDVVELARPKIEGWITGALSWPIDARRQTAFTFTIEEAA